MNWDWAIDAGQQILMIVVPTLATVIGAYLVRLLNMQLKKAGVELTQAQEERINQLVQDAIRATEEAARRDGGMTSEQKRAMTIDAAAEAISKDKVTPDLGPGELTAKIDSQLPVVRKEIAPE